MTGTTDSSEEDTLFPDFYMLICESSLVDTQVPLLIY